MRNFSIQRAGKEKGLLLQSIPRPKSHSAKKIRGGVFTQPRITAQKESTRYMCSTLEMNAFLLTDLTDCLCNDLSERREQILPVSYSLAIGKTALRRQNFAKTPQRGKSFGAVPIASQSFPLFTRWPKPKDPQLITPNATTTKTYLYFYQSSPRQQVSGNPFKCFLLGEV